MWYFEKLITVSTCIDVFPWDLDTMIRGYSHTCDLDRYGVNGHLGVNDLWFKFLKNGSLYPHTLIYFHGTYDPWVESHMWPQQSWGQTSSRGQWPLIHSFFFLKLLYPHTLTYFHGTYTMILGWSHTCDPNKSGVKGHLGVTFWLSFLKNSHCIYILWCITMGWTQWSLGRVAHGTSTCVGSKVI